jgi:hypothetical protein
MHGTQHRIVAAAAWPAVATAFTVPHWQVALGVIPAVAFSAGITSPDVDNARTWKKLDKWIPDEMLGAGGPLGHRELVHWWGIPALAALFLWWKDLGPAEFALWAAVVGWGSHDAMDAPFGQGGYSIRPGIPVLPWGPWRISLGFKSDGIASAILIWPIAGGCWWYTLGHPGSQQALAWAATALP